MKNTITDSIFNEALLALQELIKVPSVLDESDSGVGHPFGKNVVLALEKALEICENIGFRTFKDPEGYYGYAEIGEGVELFGLLCHMDVVPAGDLTKWNSAPFDPIVKDNLLIGRGSLDDKGPSIAALFAVKALIDAGITFKGRLRFIFGTDEENLWRCMEKYNEKEESITLGFVPDAAFPLTYAEKGLLQVYLTGAGSKELSVNAGSALNVVPDLASYDGDRLNEVKEILDAKGFSYNESEQGITVLGKSIHAKDAPDGVNAITRLAMALSEVFNHPSLDFLGKLVQENATGENVVGKTIDEASGELTMNFASLSITPVETKIGVDMRLPVTFEKADIAKKLKEKAKSYGLSYHEHDFLDSLYVPIESELVQTLLAVYRDHTGDHSEPMISGGATFARTMKNCVAFGAMFPDTPDLMHQPNESWSLDSMKKCMEIYADAIERLWANPQ
ncbi:MAG: M20 family metallopeptidase [Streptococcaceae bacterium]|jgi:predicted dipeptidase|nr:M20 family metallopeptidase [Streptococcaceae bacterium]